MPTAKKRITITVTGQIERDLDIIWSAYPNLRNSAIETIAFILTLKASEIVTGQTSTSRIQQEIRSVATDEQPEETEAVIDLPTSDEDDEWSDS